MRDAHAPRGTPEDGRRIVTSALREGLIRVQQAIGVEFRDPAILERALRHRSACLEEPLNSNERMEFLGDAVVGLVVCEQLYARFPAASEGDLAKAKAFLVSEPTLAAAARAVHIDDAVELSCPEEAMGGRGRPSILSDAFEAVVAAVLLDRGVRAARRFVRAALKDAMRSVAQQEYQRDYKSALQELVQAQSKLTPVYRIVQETGKDHDKTFTAVAQAGERVLGTGTGKSKKSAEQEAARSALVAMGGQTTESETTS
ncbi:MAG TPA: ribonuclease III [Chthonomonadales bacterium]|nr:ribonuclease III [Chthonomonadales bacterium]